MPTMKTPEQRGPFGWWAYETRADVLGLSPEQVVSDLGKYNAATLRKAEADSEDMSGPLWRAITAYYQRAAAKRGIALRAAPAWDAAEVATAAGDIGQLVSAIDRLVAEMRLAREREQDVAAALSRAIEALGSLPTHAETAASAGQPALPESVR